MAKSKLNISLLKQALQIKQANVRQTTSHVKTRGEVSGGGRKPWRQKGTGRARAGTSRSPIWIGGGIVFGPSKDRTYKRHLPRKMNQAAIAQYIEHLQSEKMLTVVDSLSIKEPRTKLALQLLKDNGIENEKVLLITEKIEPELLAGTGNLKNVSVIVAGNPSILDYVAAKKVLVEKGAAKNLGLVIGEKAKVATKKPTAKKSVKK